MLSTFCRVGGTLNKGRWAWMNELLKNEHKKEIIMFETSGSELVCCRRLIEQDKAPTIHSLGEHQRVSKIRFLTWTETERRLARN